jgi:hypothetical protein
MERTMFRYRLKQGGDVVAAVEAGNHDAAFAEIMHYAAVYKQDGPVSIEWHNGRRFLPYRDASLTNGGSHD